MNGTYVVMFLVVVAGVIAAIWLLPPTGKLELKAVPGQ